MVIMVEVNLKKMNKKQLDKHKIKTREKFFSAEKELENIEKEYTRRIPFVSLADEARANDKRSQDRRICDVWGCKNDTVWRFMVRFGDFIFSLFLCGEHAKDIYGKTFVTFGSMSRAKEGW
jgi:hypothetical protein